MEDRGVVPAGTYKLALDTFICAVAASGIIAWFHGKKGRQQVTPMEIGLLLAVGIVWILVGAWLLMP